MSKPHPTRRFQAPAARAGIWLGRLCRVAFVFLPVIFASELARTYDFNTLHLDDWAYVPLYEKAVNGGLTPHDFFAGYLEHRPAVARAIAIATTLLSKGDVRWQCAVAFAAITLAWLNCGLLLRRALGDWRRIWLPWALMGWVMFCPVQWQELLWPSCHMDTLPLLFLTSSMLVLGRERMSLWLRAALCAVFACLATYSFAAGLTLWVLVPLAVLCGYGFPEVASRTRFLLVWSVPMLIILFLYFHDLKNEEPGPFAYGQGHEDTMTHSFAAVLRAPEKGIKFALTLLGANFARGVFGNRGMVALAMGIAGAGAFALGLSLLWRNWRQFAARRAALPLAMIALYGLCVSGMVAAGRAWASKDVGGALNNRYACFATAFTAGLVGWLAVHAAYGRERRGSAAPAPSPSDDKSGAAESRSGEFWRDDAADGRAPAWVQTAATPLGGVLFGLLIANWCYGMNMMASWQGARLQGAVDVHFSQVLGLAQDRGHDPLNIRLVQERAAIMDRLGFLERPLARTLDLKQFKIRGAGLEDKLGRMTGTDRDTEGITIFGYATQSSSGRTADGILITCDDGSARGRQIVELVAPDNLPAFYMTSTMKDLQYVVLDQDRPKRLGAWRARIRRDVMPKGAKLRIEAWILDFRGMMVKEIGNGFTISN